jgi:hypothetical protein
MEGNSEVESRLRKILVIKSLRDRASPRALRIIQYYSEFPYLPISVTFLENHHYKLLGFVFSL